MESRSSLWQLLTLTLYSCGVALVALAAGWSLSVSIVFLCVVPLVVLLYERPLALAPLIGALFVGGSMLGLIAAVGQVTGAWYGVVVSSWQWMGVSLEMILFVLVHTLYLLVLYEFFFDDGKSGRSLRRHVLPAICFLTALGLTYAYLFAVLVVSFAFAWIIGTLLVVLSVTILLLQGTGLYKLLRKACMFGLVTWPLSCAIELVALYRGTHLFAFSSEYFGEITVLGVALPYEQLLFMFVWPFVLALVYELFVDDGA